MRAKAYDDRPHSATPAEIDFGLAHPMLEGPVPFPPNVR